MSIPYIFYIHGLKCAGCRKSLEEHLKTSTSFKLTDLVIDITTDDPKRALITIQKEAHDEQEVWNEIKQHIEQQGLTCESPDYPPSEEENLDSQPPKPEKKPGFFKKLDLFLFKMTRSHWLLGALGCTAGLSLLIASLALGSLPLAAMIPIACLSTLLTLLLGARSYFDAWKKLSKAKTITMDTLFSISTISVIIVSITAFFVPWLPMMFEAGLLIYGFRHVGLAIEDTLKQQIHSAKFQDRVPKIINLFYENKIIPLPLKRIKPQDIIIVNPGEIIPLDGTCEEDSWIYTTITNGSSMPASFSKGETVLAGMKLAEQVSELKIRVTKTVKDSYLARIDRGIAQSIAERAPLEIKTERILTYFIPTVIGLAITSGVIVGLFFPPALAIQCALSVLVSACPCTLGLIIPLAVKTGMNKAAEHGVQYKSAKILQQAEQIDTIVFDLNGTLTTGVPVVKHCSIEENTHFSATQLLAICSALEKNSTHPIGKAIHHYTQSRHIQPTPLDEIDSKQHGGITGTQNGKQFTIGSLTLMQNQQIDIPNLKLPHHLAAGDSMVYLAEGKKLISYFIITDPLRKEAVTTISTLKKMGKKIHLCTGADQETAHRYAKALQIETVFANRQATEKPEDIKALQNNHHRVAMIGDAGNDAQAIAASDFGIAIVSKNSDELTQQHAGAVIHNDSLLAIPSAFSVSQQTVSNIKQNLIMSLSYNIAAILVSGGLLVAFGLTLNPAVGVALMAIQACLILSNVYRFKNLPLEHLKTNTSDKPFMIDSSKKIATTLASKKMPEANCQPSDSVVQDKNINQSKQTLWQTPVIPPYREEELPAYAAGSYDHERELKQQA